MKPIQQPHPGFTLIEALVITCIILWLAGVVLQPFMESRSYNKLTGAHTTWWDALWVELRVQDQPTLIR